jgi:hypothetical protein
MKKFLIVLSIYLFSNTFVFSQYHSGGIVFDIFPQLYYLNDFQVNKLLEQNGFAGIKNNIEAGIGLGYNVPISKDFLFLTRMDVFGAPTQKSGDKQTEFSSLFANISIGYYVLKKDVWRFLLSAGPSYAENYLTIMKKGSINLANVEQSSARQYNLYLGAPIFTFAVHNEFFPSERYHFYVIIGYNLSLSRAKWITKNAFLSGISSTENLSSFYFSVSKAF